jgi:hypothetical protein
MRHWMIPGAAILLVAAMPAACTAPVPPTITPAPTAGAGGTVQEIQVNPRPGATGAVAVAVPPVAIGAMVGFRDPGGAFSLDLPVGWVEDRQTIDPTKGDVKLGTYFQPVERNAMLSITQFDSGKAPESLGVTINQVLQLSGVMDQPNYAEIDREKVIERESSAMRVQLSYTRTDGVDMHSLVLFQVDGTVFSMVHLGVVAGSWQANEGRIRDILASYRVPAAGG